MVVGASADLDHRHNSRDNPANHWPGGLVVQLLIKPCPRQAPPRRRPAEIKKSKVSAITAKELLKALAGLHAGQGGWVFIPEMRFGTSYGFNQEQRFDAWAINAWRTRGGAEHLRRAFEIKVSAADVRAELLNPDKRWPAYAVSNEFYFVAPAGLVNPKHLTRDDGLIEWTGDKLTITKAPRVREAMPPKWSFVASLARRVLEVEAKSAAIPASPFASLAPLA